MAVVVPTTYIAQVSIKLNGTVYAKGASITPAVMASQRHANMLVSSGKVKPSPDPHRRRGPFRRRPTTVHNLYPVLGIKREGTAMGTTQDYDEEPRNTLTDTGMESNKEDREKAAEKFAKGVEELKAAGDPTDFAQERVRTSPDNKSEHAADDEMYPEDTKDDASNPGVEPGTEDQFLTEEEKDEKHKARTKAGAEGPHPTAAEKQDAEIRRSKTESGDSTAKEHQTVAANKEKPSGTSSTSS
jgi:hypothetical protein